MSDESGFAVFHDSTFTWHPGADQYVVTEHGHLQLRRGRNNIAEFRNWDSVVWHERVSEYEPKIEERIKAEADRMRAKATKWEREQLCSPAVLEAIAEVQRELDKAKARLDEQEGEK